MTAARRRLAVGGAGALLGLVGCNLGAPPVTTTMAPFGHRVTDLTAGDLDGDGDPDLVAWTTDGYAVALNDGAGAFPTAREVTVGDVHVGTVTLADVDGDGLLDMVENPGSGPYLDVRLGTGDGTFANARTSLAVPGGFLTAAAADIDGDGDTDLLAGNRAGVVVFRNAGAGSFGRPVIHDTAGWAAELAVSDLDGDGDVDVAASVDGVDVTDRDPAGLAVLRGDGAGGFGPPEVVRTGPVPAYGRVRLALGDVDGDGDEDAVIAPAYQDAVTTLRNDGTGRFAVAGTVTGPPETSDVAAADIDGDGRDDVVTPDAVWFGTADATLARRRDLAPADGLHPSVVAGDLDGDGAPDVAVARDDEVDVLLNGLAGGDTGEDGR